MLYYPNKAYNPSRQTTTRHGFTLMELLVVVAILVVLAAVAVPSYFTYVEYSRRQAAATSLPVRASRTWYSPASCGSRVA